MNKLVEEVEMPPLEFVMELAKGFREAMGFRLFIFFGYVLQVQNLCEWRERKIPLFDLEI